MMTSRKTCSKAFQLTARDVAVLRIVALHSAATRADLMNEGLFGSVSRANRRLRRLTDFNYLRRIFLAEGISTASTVYTIGPRAVEPIAKTTGLDRIELVRMAKRKPGRTFLEHSLACLRLRQLIERSAADMGAQVIQYLPEPYCRHEYTIVGAKGIRRRIIKPDGFAHVRHEAVSCALFLEVDRGFVSHSQMGRMFERYQTYLTDGAFSEAYGLSSFGVLVVTTAGWHRIKNLSCLGPRNGQLEIRFTTYDLLRDHGFFGSIWSDGQRDSLRPLLSSVGRQPGHRPGGRDVA